jgi:hypothetical protein
MTQVAMNVKQRSKIKLPGTIWSPTPVILFPVYYLIPTKNLSKRNQDVVIVLKLEKELELCAELLSMSF